jgi:hypothetical protein
MKSKYLVWFVHVLIIVVISYFCAKPYGGYDRISSYIPVLIVIAILFPISLGLKLLFLSLKQDFSSRKTRLSSIIYLVCFILPIALGFVSCDVAKVLLKLFSDAISSLFGLQILIYVAVVVFAAGIADRLQEEYKNKKKKL